MNDICIIYNPTAHSEKAAQFRETIERLAAGHALCPTRAPGDARELAAEAARQGYRVVVAAGGDGTVNQVANGLVGTDSALGVLPVGTMNVFAAELGVPTDIEAAWEIITTGKPKPMDVARANSSWFVQLAGIGLDAQVVEATTWESKRALGPLSYIITTAQLAARRPPDLTVETPFGNYQGSFVLIGNGRYYGGPFTFFKDAKLDDGQLDVLVFKNLGYLDLARYLGSIAIGAHTRLEDVEYFQTSQLTVRSDVSVPFEADGELAGRLPVDISVQPGGLHVIRA